MHVNIHFVQLLLIIATIHPFSIVGRDATMEQVGLTSPKAVIRLPECANDTQHNPCGHKQANSNHYKI